MDKEFFEVRLANGTVRRIYFEYPRADSYLVTDVELIEMVKVLTEKDND